MCVEGEFSQICSRIVFIITFVKCMGSHATSAEIKKTWKLLSDNFCKNEKEKLYLAKHQIRATKLTNSYVTSILGY